MLKKEKAKSDALNVDIVIRLLNVRAMKYDILFFLVMNSLDFNGCFC